VRAPLWSFNSAYERIVLHMEIAPLKGQRILLRLLGFGERCLAKLPAPLGLRRTGAPKRRESACAPQEADYKAAVERAFDLARRHERHLRGQEEEAKQVLAILEKEGELGAVEKLATAGTYAKYKAFSARSWALRYEDPGQMVQLAMLAKGCAQRLDPQTYGATLVSDFQCEAQAALANALRVAQQLDAADVNMARARELFALGTKSNSLEVHILVLEAALDADRRRFEPAIGKLEKVYRYHRWRGDQHLAGKALITQGLYHSYAGDSERALDRLQRGFASVDASRDPALAYAALHNQVSILSACGRFREAEKQLFLLRPLQPGSGRVNQLKIRWIEAQIDAGLERFERAERTLLEVREEMAAIGRGYDSALISLDLASVLMAQRWVADAAEVVSRAYETFMALHIDREALASLVILRTAFDVGIVTRAMVEEVAAYLQKVESDPEAKFERRAWGG
jgi:tetratricopeptide (TPR) repeat protein